MSSAFSPMTGIRENPERKLKLMACRSDLFRSMNTISVRGTMTSRAKVSPRSNTEWIIFRSSSSIKSSAPARSTISRSSAAVSNGPSRKPLPGVKALPMTMSSVVIGPRIVARNRVGRAAIKAMRSACWRPKVRGATPRPM